MNLDELNTLAERTYCMSFNHLLKPEVVTILRAGSYKFLDAEGCSAVELMFSPKVQTTFNNMGDLRSTLTQKIAIAQVKNSGKNVQDRLKELHAITDEIIKKVNSKEIKESVIPLSRDVPQGGLAQVIELENEAESVFQIGLALCKYVEDAKGSGQKIIKLSELLDTKPTGRFAEWLDIMAGDYIEDQNTLWKDAFEGIENPKEKLSILLNLAQSEQGVKIDPPASASETLKSIYKICGESFAARTKSALATPLISIIENKKQPISGTKDLLAEAMEIYRLTKSLEARPIPGYNDDLQKALMNRFINMMETASVKEYLTPFPSDLERIGIALYFLKLCFESNSRNVVTGVIKSLINQWSPPNDFNAIPGTRAEKISILTDVSVRMGKSPLADDIKADYNKKLNLLLNA